MKNGTVLVEPVSPGTTQELVLSALEPGVPKRFANVGWDDYERFLETVGDRHYRTYYTDGEYGIVMPLPVHEIWAEILGLMIFVLAEELDQPLKNLGSATVRREDLEKGLEPDRCYYLENEPLVCQKRSLDFTIDPPPDLAVEVEVTSSVAKRMSIYMALRVPEVWRYKEDSLTVNRLAENGEYEMVERSRFFPQVALNELVRFVKLYDQIGQSRVVKSFREWVRRQIAAGWPNT